MGLRNGVLFVLMGLIWGSSFAWIKVAIQEIGPFTLVALRLLFGALGGLLILLLYRPPLPRRRAEWLALALVGLTNTAFPFVLISWGEQTVDSSVASVLNSSIPLFTLPIAHFMLADERISARKLVGLLIGFSGVLVLISRDLRLEGLTENMVGQLAILLATLLYAFSGVFVRRNLGGVSPLVQTMAPLVVADGAIWIGVLTVESPLRLPALPITWLAIVWLGLLGTCLAYLMFYNLLHSIGATRTSMVTYLIAVVGVIIGIVFLNEPLDWRLALGALLVICGIWVVNHRRRQPSPLPAAD